MATDTPNTVALHLRSKQDDSAFVDEFSRVGIAIRPVNQLSEAVALLNVFARSVPTVFAIVPAQHGGIALLDLLIDLDILKNLRVVMIDPERDARIAIKALRLGAADYFIGGMPAEEIRARIAALMDCQPPAPRASSLNQNAVATTPELPAPAASTRLNAGAESLSINASLRAIRKGDMWVSLSPIEWRLFEELINNRGRVVNFADLVRRGLNRDRVTASETSLLRLHMSRLRAKLNAHFDRELNIITLRGRGYMLT